MNSLDFDFHKDKYKDLLSVQNQETKDAALLDAARDHKLAVQDELWKFTGRALETAHKIGNEKAQQYMKYGVGRRLRMMRVAYRGIFDIVEADRKVPLPNEQMAAVSRDLNIIYINIRGALDNYAWSLYHHHGMGKTNKLQDTQVGLFVKVFRNDARLAGLKALINSHMDWNNELKSRRDPSAHRMPLYVPPAALNEAEAERHQQISNERWEAIRKGEFELDQKLSDEQSILGTFTPHFLHDPDDGGFPIFPTVPTDVGKLITIGTGIHEWLLQAPAKA